MLRPFFLADVSVSTRHDTGTSMKYGLDTAGFNWTRLDVEAVGLSIAAAIVAESHD